MKNEIVDIRYVAKILFLAATSFNLGHTFGVTWLGLLFVIFFGITGFLNGSRRKEFAKRPKFNKVFAYGAIVPLALYWVVTPGVENGVNPMMIFLPGVYLLFLAALQERSRGNGGFEVFVAFDGVMALLLSMYSVPRGWAWLGITALLLALFAYSRRGTAWYKYLFFILLIACLGGIFFGGWLYWRAHRYEYSSRMTEDYYQRERVMGFDPVASLGNFGSNYNGKYNNQVVLRVWDSLPPRYLKAASYEKYVAGIWKLPTEPVKTLTPAYYQVDYAVMEVEDSLTYESAKVSREVWVQSSINNFGFIFAPYGAVGFAVKDVDSLQYYSGGMAKGLDQNGKRSDWYYFACNRGSACKISDSLVAFRNEDLYVGSNYISLMDSVVKSMNLFKCDSSKDSCNDEENLQKILKYYKDNFVYALHVPELERWRKVSRDPLPIFWRVKKGFCEYYATLSVLALRHIGIPARYVTGFAFPERVAGRPYAVFRRKQAHAWVEAFVDGRWIVFDPTPPVVAPLDFEPNRFSSLFEGLRGRAAYVMHLLKEGGWRRSVDSWQNYTQKFLDSSIPFIFLGILISLLAGFRFYRYWKNRSKNASVKTAKGEFWSKKLDRAERDLNRLGFRREAGETVGTFLNRLEKTLAENSISELKTLEKSESCKLKVQSALDVLKEYERVRWQK